MLTQVYDQGEVATASRCCLALRQLFDRSLLTFAILLSAGRRVEQRGGGGGGWPAGVVLRGEQSSRDA